MKIFFYHTSGEMSTQGGQIVEAEFARPSRHRPEDITPVLERPCSHSVSCVECSVAKPCQNCNKPMSECEKCRILYKCPMFHMDSGN